MESTEEKPAGQEWQWCLVGNIVGEHKYGETDEIPGVCESFSVIKDL